MMEIRRTGKKCLAVLLAVLLMTALFPLPQTADAASTKPERLLVMRTDGASGYMEIQNEPDSDTMEVQVVPVPSTATLGSNLEWHVFGVPDMIELTANGDKATIQHGYKYWGTVDVVVIDRDNGLFCSFTVGARGFDLDMNPPDWMDPNADPCLVENAYSGPAGSTTQIDIIDKTTFNEYPEEALYFSTNPDVVKVDSSGKVTLLNAAKGTQATIRVIAPRDGWISDYTTMSFVVTFTASPSVPDPTSLTLSKTKVTLKKPKKTTQLKATVLPAKANQSVKFASSNKAVATVDATGKITAVAKGQAVITARTVNNLVKKCTVKVTYNTISMTVTPNPVKLTVPKQKLTLKSKISVAKGSTKLTYTIKGKTSAFKLSKTGKITARKEGKGVVRVTAPDGYYVDIPVTVIYLPSSIKLSKGELTIKSLKKTSKLTATVLPKETKYKGVKFETPESAGVIKVSSKGVITPLRNGTEMVRVSSTKKTSVDSFCLVTVDDPKYHAKQIILSKDGLTFTATGQKQSFTAKVLPEKSVQAVSVRTTDSAVATVDQFGGTLNVTAKGPGECYIEIRAHNGLLVRQHIVVNLK